MSTIAEELAKESNKNREIDMKNGTNKETFKILSKKTHDKHILSLQEFLNRLNEFNCEFSNIANKIKEIKHINNREIETAASNKWNVSIITFITKRGNFVFMEIWFMRSFNKIQKRWEKSIGTELMLLKKNSTTAEVINSPISKFDTLQVEDIKKHIVSSANNLN